MATANPTPQAPPNPTPQAPPNPTPQPSANPTAQQRAAIAAQKAKLAKQRIKDIWTAQMSITYEKAQKVSHAEVDAALEGLTWEKEYQIPGKNTHVNFLLRIYELKNFFQLSNTKVINQIFTRIKFY